MGLSDAVRQAMTQQQLATLALNSGAGAAAGFANATAGLQGAQQSALAGATADANKAGVDAAGQAAIAKIINQGFDPRLTALATRAAGDAGFYAGQQSAVNTRFAGYQSGIDANESELEQKLAQQQLANGSGGGSSGGGGGGGGQRGGGSAKVTAALGDQPFDPLHPSKFFAPVGGQANYKLLVSQDPGNYATTPVGRIYTNRGEAERSVAQSQGVPDYFAQKLFPQSTQDTNQPQSPKFKGAKQQLVVIANPWFQAGAQAATEALQAGQSRAEFVAQVNKQVAMKLTRKQQLANKQLANLDRQKAGQLLIALYGPRFSR